MATVETSARDPYAVLGVERGATDDEIAAAFRARAKELHPDRRPGDASALERFQQLTRAYQSLRGPDPGAPVGGRRPGGTASPSPARTQGSSAPLFATPRRARVAIGSGAVLGVVGILGAIALGLVATGDPGQTITLWIAVGKCLVCGPVLVGLGLHRLRRLRAAS